ncbi:MAG: hypothetical protein ACRD8A_14625 [Candidatus Acidiferrales bacterium]
MDDILTSATPLSIDGEVNATCASVAAEILASVDSVDQQTIDEKLRAFAALAIREAIDNKTRAGRPGAGHCFFCGARVVRNIRCDCGFAESFRCCDPDRFICDDCRAAHTRVARHLREMFGAPKKMRSNCRKFLLERELYRAARTLEGGADYNCEKGCGLTHHLSQACAEDDGPDEFRRSILDAFRRSLFLDFQALADALAAEKDLTLLRSAMRAIGQLL